MKILLVEDDEQSREVMNRILARIGHQVISRANGEEALQELAHEQFELLLTDLRLPVISGLELLQYVKQVPALEELPVVVITGYGSLPAAKEVLQAGALDCLFKPLKLELLLGVIERVARARTGGQEKEGDK